MTVYAKIENNKLVTAYNGYNGITGLADIPELCLANGFTAYTEEEISGYYAGTHQIIDGVLTDITSTPEYIAEQFEKAKASTYYKIISKYDQAIKNGVFKINSEYYGNMSWYDTWTKAVALYESGLVLSDTFTVRLYKSPTSEDGVYYNYNTTQTLSSFKSMLQTLNSRQFLLYQPIRNNLISQLKLAATIEEVNIIENLIDNSFGDIIDETTTIVQDGE